MLSPPITAHRWLAIRCNAKNITIQHFQDENEMYVFQAADWKINVRDDRVHDVDALFDYLSYIHIRQQFSSTPTANNSSNI